MAQYTAVSILSYWGEGWQVLVRAVPVCGWGLFTGADFRMTDTTSPSSKLRPLHSYCPFSAMLT